MAYTVHAYTQIIPIVILFLKLSLPPFLCDTSNPIQFYKKFNKLNLGWLKHHQSSPGKAESLYRTVIVVYCLNQSALGIGSCCRDEETAIGLTCISSQNCWNPIGGNKPSFLRLSLFCHWFEKLRPPQVSHCRDKKDSTSLVYVVK